ncbi:MAG: flagellar biosynthesis protein FlhF [Isosphaerales bacterium]
MRSKTYRAKTMKEALTRVRRDLGGDAVILSAREVRRRRLLGLGPRALVEVTATDTMPSEMAVTSRPGPAAEAAGGASRVVSAVPVLATSATLHARFGEELGRLHTMVETLSRHGHIDHLLPDLPSALVPTYSQLIEADVPEVLTRRLMRQVALGLEPDQFDHAEVIRAALCEAVEQCIPIAPPIRAIAGTRRVVALVGPTGVGKTTTVAKLAANFKLAHGVRVGLITVDTYRIAAVEQLKTYAEIIDLPLVVVNDPVEMPRAFDELGAVDLIFIDTAGRSPRDEVKIRELAEFLAQARPDEVHLVLSAVAGHRSLRAAVERFTTVHVDRLILTKLDEADSMGGVLAVLGLSSRPVSYLTTGQAVPDDIEPADRKRLARLILRQEDIG